MSFSSTTMLLGEVSIHHLRDVSPKLWNAPLECEEPSFHRVEIVGEMKSSVKFSVRLPFFFLSLSVFFFTCYCQSVLILKEPKNCPLLCEVYKKQQQRLHAIVDDLLNFEQVFNVVFNAQKCCSIRITDFYNRIRFKLTVVVSVSARLLLLLKVMM